MRRIVCLLYAILFLFGSMNLSNADCGIEENYDEEVSLSGLEDESDGEEPCIMCVTGKPFVRLRQTPSTKKPYIDKMPYGSMVTVVATQVNDLGEEWSLVIYNEQYGYCMTKYLSDRLDCRATVSSPSTMDEAFGTTLLQKGNKTPSYRVKNLQLCLMKGGFLNDETGVDGYFGRNTFKALCEFQKSQGLAQAGRAGKTTKTRLWHLYANFLKLNGVMQ